VAKIFEIQSFRKGKSAEPPSQNEPNISGSSRISRSDFLVSLFSRPGSSLRGLLDSGARFLLVTGAVYGLYLSGNGLKSGVANAKQDKQLQSRAISQPSPPAGSPSTPSPATFADTAAVEGTVASKQTDAVPHSPALSAPRYPPVKYEATRKKVFGGCNGQLELTGSGLRFRCPNQVDLVFPVAAIAKAHKDGVLLKSGEKYHFMIANHTRGEVQAIFVSWLSRVQRSPQASRLSSF
jgi:hypothetical protein